MTEIIVATDRFAKLNPRANLIGPFYDLGFAVDDETNTNAVEKPVEVENKPDLNTEAPSTSTNEEEVLN